MSRAPRGACGLKPLAFGMVSDATGSRPSRGVRIETWSLAKKRRVKMVAPLAGRAD